MIEVITVQTVDQGEEFVMLLDFLLSPGGNHPPRRSAFNLFHHPGFSLLKYLLLC